MRELLRTQRTRARKELPEDAHAASERRGDDRQLVEVARFVLALLVRDESTAIRIELEVGELRLVVEPELLDQMSFSAKSCKSIDEALELRARIRLWVNGNGNSGLRKRNVLRAEVARRAQQ